MAKLAEAPADYNCAIKELKDRSKELAQQQRRLIDSIKAGIPAALLRDEATHLAEELVRNDRDLRARKANPPAGVQTTVREVEEFLTSFEDVFAAGKPSQRKRLVRTRIGPEKAGGPRPFLRGPPGAKSWCPEGNPHSMHYARRQ